jgi:hypothetical protein
MNFHVGKNLPPYTGKINLFSNFSGITISSTGQQWLLPAKRDLLLLLR